jgi:hypothetical protein
MRSATQNLFFSPEVIVPLAKFSQVQEHLKIHREIHICMVMKTNCRYKSPYEESHCQTQAHAEYVNAYMFILISLNH